MSSDNRTNITDWITNSKKKGSLASTEIKQQSLSTKSLVILLKLYTPLIVCLKQYNLTHTFIKILRKTIGNFPNRCFIEKTHR